MTDTHDASALKRRLYQSLGVLVPLGFGLMVCSLLVDQDGSTYAVLVVLWAVASVLQAVVSVVFVRRLILLRRDGQA